jgi:hypothetical protein
MTWRLSDLTWSTLEFRINELADPTKKDHATSRLMRQAGVAVGTKCDEDVMAKVERWIADTSREAYVRALEDIGTHRRCDGIMIPLDVDVYWTGRHMLVRRGMLAQTVMTAAIGRKVGNLVAHAALSDAGRVVGIEEDTGMGFDILLLDEGMAPWRETVSRIFGKAPAKAA